MDSTVGSDKSAVSQVVIADDDDKDKLDLEEEEEEEDSNRAAMVIQDDHDHVESAALARKMADDELEDFAHYRARWESYCCNHCDHFEYTTALSSMQFTHYTPGIVPHNSAGTAVETLQIFSIKLKLTDDIAGFELPLSVYGMVAVRDTVDSRRNILFSCDRTVAQELTQDDSFLRLTGPSRAIVSTDTVYFEIQLKVKAGAASQDRPLITRVHSYNGGCGPGVATLSLKNVFCTLEVCLQTLKRTVQATIVGVQIVKKKELWPLNFTYGGLVACTPLPTRTTTPVSAAADSGVVSSNKEEEEEEVVLVESKGGELREGDGGYVHLWRQVVCVEAGGGLDVVIQAYSKSGAVGAQGRVHFAAQNCNISQQQCIVGQAQVTVTVAWSLVPDDMEDVMLHV